MEYILGIDQGSTHTRAAVSTLEGEIRAACQGPGACHSYVGMEKAMAAIRDTACAVLAQGGVAPEQVHTIYAGVTGADWPDEYYWLRDEILKLGLCGRVEVTNDSLIAMRGGTEQPYGAILIAGSGGNCAIRSPAGEVFIYHYYHDNDLQGGAAIGRRALNAVYRAETGREAETGLRGRVLGFYGLETVDQLLRADVEKRLAPDHKELALLVFELAFQGDPVAVKIVRQFGEGCAELVAAGLRRLGMASLEVEVVLSGSIFKAQGPLLIETIAAGVHQIAPRARLVNARYEPVVGAVLLGLEGLHITIDAGIKENIERSAAQQQLIRIPVGAFDTSVLRFERET